MRTYDEALDRLTQIIDRLDKEAAAMLSPAKARKLTIGRDALAAALTELRGGPAPAEPDDVPVAVAELANWLTADAGERVLHPYAGGHPDRTGTGHCWVCGIVGHPVAHPTRTCLQVGCVVDHGHAAPVDEPAQVAPVVQVLPDLAVTDHPIVAGVFLPGLREN